MLTWVKLLTCILNLWMVSTTSFLGTTFPEMNTMTDQWFFDEKLWNLTWIVKITVFYLPFTWASFFSPANRCIESLST